MMDRISEYGRYREGGRLGCSPTPYVEAQRRGLRLTLRPP